MEDREIRFEIIYSDGQLKLSIKSSGYSPMEAIGILEMAQKEFMDHLDANKFNLDLRNGFSVN